jgi:hypothetical protein
MLGEREMLELIESWMPPGGRVLYLCRPSSRLDATVPPQTGEQCCGLMTVF